MRVNRVPIANGSGATKNRFEEVFEENYELVFKYLRRRVNEHLAADLTAETFSAALDAFDQFDPARGTPRAWLLGIATNQMRREARREIRELRAYARGGVDPIAAEPMSEADERLDARDLQPALAGGLASLKEDDRDALLLLCWGELSYPEIAEAQAVAVGTVKSRISRARRQLRASLGAHQNIRSAQAAKEAAKKHG